MKKDFIITEEKVKIYAQDIEKWIRQKTKQAKKDGVVLGLSGGIDSAVVARLCQLANIRTDLVLMPYGSINNKDALDFIQKFKFTYSIFDIKSTVDTLIQDTSNKLATANVRPRIRMTYLYQYAQINNLCVIGTGNLSERTVGYFTKWGDGSNDFNPLGNLTKTEVYVLAKYLQIPESIIRKAPSADLWEGQTDEKELGITYKDLDEYILTGTSKNNKVNELIDKKIKANKHKLKQIPIYKPHQNVI